MNRRTYLTLVGGGVSAVAATATVTAQETPIVEVGSNYYDPIGLFIKPGTTVQFEFVSGSHSVTAYTDRIPSEATAFDTDVRSSGTFEHRFTEPGTYDYYCIPHQTTQVGRIVVGEPGGPAEADAIPHGSVPDSEEIVDRETIPVDDFNSSESGFGMPHHGNGMVWADSLPSMARWLVLPGSVLGALAAMTYIVHRNRSVATDDRDPTDELKNRFERGNITREEYERRRDKLEDS